MKTEKLQWKHRQRQCLLSDVLAQTQRQKQGKTALPEKEKGAVEAQTKAVSPTRNQPQQRKVTALSERG